MGNDEAALLRLWREKRGEIEPENLSGNLIVQLGLATEDLNRRWYQANSGQVLTDVQRRIRHPVLRWMGATLDGRVEGHLFRAQLKEFGKKSKNTTKTTKQRASAAGIV
jgi:predicted phage-related endonuclease